MRSKLHPRRRHQAHVFMEFNDFFGKEFARARAAPIRREDERLLAVSGFGFQNTLPHEHTRCKFSWRILRNPKTARLRVVCTLLGRPLQYLWFDSDVVVRVGCKTTRPQSPSGAAPNRETKPNLPPRGAPTGPPVTLSSDPHQLLRHSHHRKISLLLHVFRGELTLPLHGCGKDVRQ